MLRFLIFIYIYLKQKQNKIFSCIQRLSKFQTGKDSQSLLKSLASTSNDV